MKVNIGQKQLSPRILVIGQEAVGKSTLGNRAESPLFICAENGLVGQEFANTPNVTPQTWQEVLDVVDTLVKDQHNYKTLVLDTVDWLEPLLFKDMCKKDGKASIEAYGFNRGNILAGIVWRGFLSRLENLRQLKDMTILFLAHCQVKTFQNPTGENYDRYQPKISKEISAITREWCDAVLFAAFEIFIKKEGMSGKALTSGARVVYTTQNPAWDAKNRYNMPEKLPLDWNEIMNATKPIKAEDVLKEIEETIRGAAFTDEDREKVKAYIEANKDNVSKLNTALNTVRVKGGK